MDRRGFFKLAGAASTAVILSKFAILPAKAQPHPDWRDAADRMGMVEEAKIEMGLIGEGTTEVEFVGYCRVTPEVRIANGIAHLKATFPLVQRGGCTVRRAGLYDRKTRELLMWQDFDSEIALHSGNTLQVNDIAIDLEGPTAPMIMRTLGIKA